MEDGTSNKALRETKPPKCTFPAPNSIEFGVGKVHFGTERGKKAPRKKIHEHFPLFLGLKIGELRPASSQQKIDKSFPPSEGLKWAIPIGKRPEKRPPKNEHSAALIAGQQTGGI